MAAVGQCELMFVYDKLFGEYNRTVAQILLTRDVVEHDHSKQNVVNTFEALMEMGIIPVVNENDTVAIDELDGQNFGDNDTPFRYCGGYRGGGPAGDPDGYRRPV